MNAGICPKCNQSNPYSLAFCSFCGEKLPWADAIRTAPPVHRPAGVEDDAPNFAYAAIGFFIPIAGLILWVVTKNDKPQRASSAIKGAGLGFGINMVVAVGVVVLLTALGGRVKNNTMLPGPGAPGMAPMVQPPPSTNSAPPVSNAPAQSAASNGAEARYITAFGGWINRLSAAADRVSGPNSTQADAEFFASEVDAVWQDRMATMTPPALGTIDATLGEGLTKMRVGIAAMRMGQDGSNDIQAGAVLVEKADRDMRQLLATP